MRGRLRAVRAGAARRRWPGVRSLGSQRRRARPGRRKRSGTARMRTRWVVSAFQMSARRRGRV
jgi:hypothetical protein